MLLVLACCAVTFAVAAGSFLTGHAAGRSYGRSEAWDEAVEDERAGLEALRNLL